MAKAPSHPNQIAFCFDPPSAPSGEAALAGFERRTNVFVGEMLNSDDRDRYAIAAEVSKLLGSDVSKAMLDAYSSPAREDHKVPFTRLMAIVAVTERYDLLDKHMREAGCGVVTGRELETAELGSLEQEIRQMQARARELRKTAPPLRRGGTGE
ncbi:MAG: hypothetical protein CL949_15740 [Erythrobacter sp.]|nr:hypothetical protein [Erythrobacter sp.]MAM39907.1 hypothetical protein [Erythrobacter sp.]|tara:strand:+ start:606 stop:1067 length:462 start_codon:yes stop_codon:yes gene_type:complete